MSSTVSEITDLRIYPIKSCRGISLKSAQLTLKGLENDRRWMFVDSENHFVTIRQRPQMTLINTAINDDTQELVITIGDDPTKSVSVPLHPTDDWLNTHTKPVTVNIWDYETEAYMFTDPKIVELFQNFIGGSTTAENDNAKSTTTTKPAKPTEISLVMKDPRSPRICGGNGSRALLGRTATVNFPDVLPLQIASESSLAELNSRLQAKNQTQITVERFRPNIVIKGDEPWSEDSWKLVRLNGSTAVGSNWLPSAVAGFTGALDVDVVARCARCQVPNVDPDTAEKDKHQPWDTLVSYRRIDEGIKFKPCFGMLGVPRAEGRVEVGMRFEVLSTTQDHSYAKGF
jgi:uncharacterized protein